MQTEEITPIVPEHYKIDVQPELQKNASVVENKAPLK